MASGLEGAKELTAQLTALGAKMAAKELRGTAKDALEITEHKARATAPQGTEPHKTYKGRIVWPGYAVSTIHIETRLNKRTGAAEAMLGVGREAFYEVNFQELGTSTMKAQPWLVPAFLSSQDAMLRQVGASLRRRVIDATKRRQRANARFVKKIAGG